MLKLVSKNEKDKVENGFADYKDVLGRSHRIARRRNYQK